MSLVSFVCHKNYFYFLIYWILEISVALIKNLCSGKLEDLEIKSDLQNEYIDLVSLNVADLLAGFLVMYTICSLPKKKIKRNESNFGIELIYNNPFYKKNKVLLLVLISFLDLFARSTYLLFYLIIKPKQIFDRFQMDWIIGVDILSRYFFSRIILKTKLYKHHFWSIIISTIGFIFMSCIDFITIFNDDKDNDNNNNDEDKSSEKMWYLFFILPRALVFPISDSINKILLSDDFLLPHSLMFDRGIIDFFFLLIFSLILFLTKKLEINYEPEHIIYIILIKLAHTVVLSIKAFCLMQAIYIYTSQYVSFLVISESFGATVNLLINIISGEDYPKIYENNIFIIAEIISIIIIIFGTLMYNEMIIVNKFGLEENTKRGLHIKEKADFNVANNEILLKDQDDSDDEDNNRESKDNRIDDGKSINSVNNIDKNFKDDNKNINEIKPNDKNQVAFEMRPIS